MKDSNFDFIKDKFDNSGVNAPEELNEQLVLEKLDGVQPVRELPPKKSKKKLALGISAAAAAAVITAGAITFTSILNSAPPVKTEQPVLSGETASLRTFNSRDEVKTELKNVMALQDTIPSLTGDYRLYDSEVLEYGADSNAAGNLSGGLTGGSSSGSKYNAAPSDSYHNSTYVQHTGVDEADTVKTSERYIFYLKDDINIFSAEGKSSKKVAEIKGRQPKGDEGFGYITDFYLSGNNLITLSSCSNYTNSGYRYFSSQTVADIYDISDIDSIKHTGSFSQGGDYISSRMIDDTLYIVSNQYISDENDMPMVGKFASSTSDSATMDEMPVSDIYAVQTPSSNSFLIVSGVNTKNGAHETNSKAIIGSGDDVYCNLDNLYVTALEYTPVVYNSMLDYAFNGVTPEGEATGGAFEDFFLKDDYIPSYNYWTPEETQIIKINLKNGLEFTASNSVKGTVNNQYSLDEYNGNLRVATTSTDENGRDVNNLYVLDSGLKQLGEVTGFAGNESIKAVRYINDTAYVITYEETDPLFVIDVSNPSKPEIKGEVKISGFSTMLVPVDDNTLLGIGYSTGDYPEYNTEMEVQDGIKIVTFDVTDKTAPKVLDTKVFQYSDSEVQYNPKALLVNFERGDYTIPYHSYSYSKPDSDRVNWYSNEYGTINFRVDNGKINIIDQYRSEKFSSSTGVEADRCVYVGNNIYLLGMYYDSAEAAIDSVEYK